MTAQAGTVYRYFRVDADHNISGDPLALSLDGGTWISAGIDYIAPSDYPPSLTAANASHPPAQGLTGYWWRALTGPEQALELQRGGNQVFGKVTDDPETPHVAWTVHVGKDE